jgi:ParB-like chromosome segregation protein Spo0J
MTTDIAAKVASALRRLDFIGTLSIDQRVEAINAIREKLHDLSPFSDEPVDFVRWVKADNVRANDYNPNSVAPPEMKLLELSILEDGYTQPIVTNLEEDVRVVIDGFHRNRVGRESDAVRQRIRGYLPVVQIRASQQSKENRMASTIRHNRARGKHQVEAMTNIVLDLRRRNWSSEKIGKQLGMDPDEVLRLAQIGGLADMFLDREFSEAWEPASTVNEDDNLVVEDENV